jgi:hypothetical protein
VTASKCHVFSFARQGPSDPGLVQRNQCLELSYPSLGSRLWSVCATVAAQVTPSIAALIPTGQRSGSSRSSCGSWITEAVRTVSGVTLCTLAQADIPHTLGQVGPVGLVGTAHPTSEKAVTTPDNSTLTYHPGLHMLVVTAFSPTGSSRSLRHTMPSSLVCPFPTRGCLELPTRGCLDLPTRNRQDLPTKSIWLSRQTGARICGILG